MTAAERRTSKEPWSIVLAGGDGQRMQSLVRRWLGRSLPKQYCTFVGARSMLQHTLDRARRLSSPGRIVTVIAAAHARHPECHVPVGAVLRQPWNRDTAAGVLLPLTVVRAQDPEATVVLFPSDHFVHPEARFLDVVRAGVTAAEHLVDRVILIGARPDGPERDYGWIEAGRPLGWAAGRRVRAVTNFLEKPTPLGAETAWAGGGSWNTLVVAAKVRTLWDLGWCCFPDLMALFERDEAALVADPAGRAVTRLYEALPARNFSRDLLEPMAHRAAVIDLEDVIWSDWGRPERIVESLQRIGRVPSFPVDLVAPFEVHREEGLAWAGHRG